MKYISCILKHNAKLPAKKYSTSDAGWDLFVSEDVTIPPHKTIDIHTNVFIDMPPFVYGRIVGRSSTMRKHHLLVNEGIIDNGYTGELFVCITNIGDEPFKVKMGMRLAQILFARIEDIRWAEVSEFTSHKSRGNAGFGSTGMYELEEE